MSTQAEYEACIEYLRRKGYWATYTALTGDGYDPKVDYSEFIEDDREQG